MGLETSVGAARIGAVTDRRVSESVAAERGADPIDLARARQYGLLARLIAAPPETGLLDQIAALQGDETPLGRALSALARAAAEADVEVLQRAHFALLIGVGRGVLLPYGSYYQTGFLHERPLAELRGDLAALGIERAGTVFEPEDHIAILCDVMAGLAAGGFEGGVDAERRMFRRHLEPWAARFFDDLKTHATEPFYRAVGALGRVFIELEAEAFGLEGEDAVRPDATLTPLHGGLKR